MSARFMRLRFVPGGLLAILLLVPAQVLATDFNVGDVLAGVSNGTYDRYDGTGVYIESISDGLGGFTTGCATNPGLTHLYTTNFSSSVIVVYDVQHAHGITQTINTTAFGGGCAESIVFDASGQFYVGHACGNADIMRFDAAGVFQQAYNVATENVGSDWIDLSIDQQTMFYTSEGPTIFRYDVANDIQLPNFATVGTNENFALRLLPPFDGTGGLMVASRDAIHRVDGSGTIAQTYDAAGEDSWFALNLDPDGTSFWAGDFGTDNFYKFDIASGNVLVGPVNAGPGGTLFGLCVFGEITGATQQISLSPADDTNFVGEDHTVTATVQDQSGPIVGVVVTFTVLSGPNAGASGTCSANADCSTDAAGQVSFTYTGSGGVGTDVIEACFIDQNGDEKCARATKTWEPPPNEPPDCDDAYACESLLWPPNHKFRSVSICGVTDPDGDPVTITVTAITQDEPLNTRGDGNTCPDAQLDPPAVRAERTGTPGIPGNGRVYTLYFLAEDGEGGECTGSVQVCVPHDMGDPTCVDDGQIYDSLGPCNGGNQLTPEVPRLSVGQVTKSGANVTFALPKDAYVEISVFDVSGRRVGSVESGYVVQGVHERTVSMEGLPSGRYFVHMQADDFKLTSSLVWIR